MSDPSVEKRYWFRAKRSGLGWGMPCSWQGWVFFLTWLAVLVVAARSLIHGHPFLFTMILAAMTVILVLACYIKGEPLSAGRS